MLVAAATGLTAVGVPAPARADDPVTVIENLPPNRDGGSQVSAVVWKALLFTTGTARTSVRSVAVGLNPPTGVGVPTDVQVRIGIHAVVGGDPGEELASLPLTTVGIAALRQTYEFGGALRIELAPSTQYALVVRSDATGARWANQIPNGFGVAGGFTVDGFRVTADGGGTWAAAPSGDNVVALVVATVPTAEPVAEPVAMTVDCGTDAPRAGTDLVCTAADGDPDIEVLWRAVAGDAVVSGPVALGPDGSGTFRVAVPAEAVGRAMTVELVEWLAPVPVGVVTGPVPRAVPAGEGPVPLGVLGLLLAVLAAGAVALGVAGSARRTRRPLRDLAAPAPARPGDRPLSEVLAELRSDERA